MFNRKGIQELREDVHDLVIENINLRIETDYLRGVINELKDDMFILRRSLGLTHEQVEKTERRFVKPPKDTK